MQSKDSLPAVSIVIIGKNEASNIHECILSVYEMDYPKELLEIIYVDTGSTDGTLDIARAAGVKVIEEFSSAPSAALARNRGLVESHNQIIHFIDGDMRIDPSYLRKAVTKLVNEDLACVFGRVIERHADTNWISRMLNIDWKQKEEGYINAPGGGGTFLKKALQEIGGYNSDLILAEETDVGIRLRNIGHRIFLINDVMAIHDYGVNSILALIKRFYSSGKARFRILINKDVSQEIKKWSYRLPLQAMAIISILLTFVFYGHLLEAVCLILLYPVIYVIIVMITDWKYIVTNKYGLDAFLHSYIYYVMKPVILLGMIKELSVYAMKLLICPCLRKSGPSKETK